LDIPARFQDNVTQEERDAAPQALADAFSELRSSQKLEQVYG
jgi:hypothetical protein